MPNIERLSEEQARAILPEFVELLRDAVEDGASVGFVPPLAGEVAEEFWRETFSEITQGKRILLVAREAGELAGTVQLGLVTKPNGLHRAEVQKLLVHTRFRQRGIARALMGAVEEAARAAGRTLLVLDTIEDSAAGRLYAELGYTRAGVIPHFALSAGGELESTVIFYRVL
jgi:ribosomal protein S18 acetylase RimI-like enzyme